VGKAMVLAWHRAGVEARCEVLGSQHSGSQWQALPDLV
jgi:hypothetical protein